MERGCSQSFVLFPPVCVRCEPVNSGQPTQTDNSLYEFCGQIVQLDSRAGGYVGSECCWHREQLCTQLYRKASLTEDGASHPSGTLVTNPEAVVLPSWLDEDS